MDKTNRKELARQRKAQAAAKALDRAARAMNEFSHYLDSVYGKGGSA